MEMNQKLIVKIAESTLANTPKFPILPPPFSTFPPSPIAQHPAYMWSI